MGGAVLTPAEAAAILFGVFFLLIILRVPVAFSLGLACLPILAIEPRLSIMSLAQETFNAYNSFILLAVPFFLLTANLMTIGGITDRLVALSRTMVGHWPGSLAQINVVLAVIYSAILSIFFYREMDRTHLYQALLDTGRLASVALFCVGTASAFGWLLAYYQIPKALLSNVTAWGLGPIGVGFFIAFVFLVVGCFLDAIPAIVIVGTVLEPLARSVDLHPIQFAIISIVSLAFGLVPPPYGLCLMIACAIAGVRLRYALKDTIIMLVPMMFVMAALIIWPSVSLFLPRLIVPDMLR